MSGCLFARAGLSWHLGICAAAVCRPTTKADLHVLTTCQQTPSLVHPIDDKQGLKHQCTSFLSFFCLGPLLTLLCSPVSLFVFISPRPLPYFIIVLAVAGCPFSNSVVLRHHQHESWMRYQLGQSAEKRPYCRPLISNTELKANCTKGDSCGF
ncbi:hypothetical protein GGI42DRAFT_335120 [Trichoderma sp. SZMC 28013]